MGFLVDKKPRINRTLISLKFVVFFVISGLTALHVLHATKPLLLGLNFSEYRTISILAPFISILGPLIAGPWADRLAAKNPNTFGRTLRLLTALFLLITALIYSCLFAIPDVDRRSVHESKVSFGCDASGAILFQERCDNSPNGTCKSWDQKMGKINLTGCTYSCQNPNTHENMYQAWVKEVPTPGPSTEQSSEFEYDDETASAVTESLRTKRDKEFDPLDPMADLAADSAGVETVSSEDHLTRLARQIKNAAAVAKVYVEPPHLCITERNEEGQNVVKQCHVYTEDTENILVQATLGSPLPTQVKSVEIVQVRYPIGDNSTLAPESEEQRKISSTSAEHYNLTRIVEFCQYPLEGFQCHIPDDQVLYMQGKKNSSNCKPMIKCQVINPYHDDSVLADSECRNSTGTVKETLVGYTIIRLLGDIFPMAALTLLNTAIVIAVRETSEGRGEVCRQYVWGAIGYVVLFSPLDLFFIHNAPNQDAALAALIILIVCFVIGALILLSASQMPLSPPEWWWHTKTGMLVVPMSAIRRYSPEILVLTLVSILFGTFWSSIHSFLNWTFTDVNAICYSGLLLVLLLFFNVDKFIEYCGHSNIFIAGFAIFVIRFTALSDVDCQWLTIVMESIEPAVIGLIWITIILYMRHAMPRKLTATGQAIAVLAFFGLGKGFGALIGLAREEKNPKLEVWHCTYQWLAIIACIVALVYFIIYNLILAPRCTAKAQHSEELISGSASQNFGQSAAGGGGVGASNGNGAGNGAGASLNGNGNGSYSPLRVYHNERGKKGQFRY
ncbi:uncharacterized protein Dwil_GK12581 [Drosophila willistoni]|uniref:Major facilitator superfamily associated domain-containing protein n=1 Tax=Drosophila willistoni TaxID=7260 RepID=B4N2X7_DROWI|nr:uncharacterized protein LOC6645137 [Drosophila willistoni]EDW78716.2 uncharacterized protein Dwil_GK12581 [Drosophila willistoni]